MTKVQIILIGHQVLFQGMFIVKNLLTRMKTGQPVRGGNKEANQAVLYFILFITLTFILAFRDASIPGQNKLGQLFFMSAGVLALLTSLVISALSLIHLKNSWRVGILKNQKTQLITTGIYRHTRNPYFVSYLLMAAGYTLLNRSLILLMLSFLMLVFIHRMIKKEEAYLLECHGSKYKEYLSATSRYLFF